MSEEFNPQCKFCTKNYYVDNQDRLLNNQKLHDKENRDKINARTKVYLINRYRKDVNFRLICKTRSRIRQTLHGKTKFSSTKYILGIDIDTYKKWLEFQKMNWSNTEVDHVKPLCMFDVFKDEDLEKRLLGKLLSPY